MWGVNVCFLVFSFTVFLVLFRKIFLVFSLVFFIFSSFSLFLFNNNIKIYADSLDASTYAIPFPPDVLQVEGMQLFPPTIVRFDGVPVNFVEPSVFNNGVFSLYPTGLEPGFYQVFSGFSQSFFQIGYTTLPPPSTGSVNPLFFKIFAMFIVSVVCVLFSLFLLKFFSRTRFTKFGVLAAFSCIVILLPILSFVKVSSFSVFDNRVSFSLGGVSEFNPSPNLVNQDTYSLDFLENMLGLCVLPSSKRASLVSNNTACAASILAKATQLYGPEGFNFLLNSKYADFFNEVCEVSSRFSAGFTPTDPIDYDFIDEGLVCNYSWLNHLVSTSYPRFDSVDKFFEYGHSLCSSLKEFSRVPDVTLRQQCLRGVGVGLYNLLKDPGFASSYCMNLPELFDPGNCTEGVFIEARTNVLKKKLYNANYDFNSMETCSTVSSDFYGLCLRVFAPEILQDYSISEFKDLCLSKGPEFTDACSTATGQMAFLSFSFTDLNSLDSVCDSRLSSSCFERFFFSHSLIPDTDATSLLESCTEFAESSGFPGVNVKGSPCDKLKDFVDRVSSGYQTHKSDESSRNRPGSDSTA